MTHIEAMKQMVAALNTCRIVSDLDGEELTPKIIREAIAAGEQAIEHAEKQKPVAKKLWCETCEGTGQVYQEHQAGCWVGGQYTCPDCDGNGYYTRPTQHSQPKAEQEPFGYVMRDEVTEQFNSVNCGTIYRLPAEGRSPLYTHPQPKRDDFKNFHRLLCERFNYSHDEKDWERDQVSLIEWIAKQVQPKREPLTDEQIRSIAKQYALGLAFPYDSPTTPEMFARAIEAAHGIKGDA